MIDICCLSQAESGLYALCIRGHAEYAPRGADIVCAAASALGYTFAAVLRRLEAEGALVSRARIHEAEGELFVAGHADRAHTDALKQSFETVKTGLQLLAESYPAHVRLR